MNDHSELQCSEDLKVASLCYVDFISNIHLLGLDQDTNLTLAVHRYKNLWLPLLTEKKPFKDLPAPLDVQFIWNLHRLRHSKVIFILYFVSLLCRGRFTHWHYIAFKF